MAGLADRISRGAGIRTRIHGFGDRANNRYLTPLGEAESRCGREDSNLHGPKAHQDLNLARLPKIPPRPHVPNAARSKPSPRAAVEDSRLAPMEITSVRPGYEVWRPNREKAQTKTTKAIVAFVLLVSAALSGRDHDRGLDAPRGNERGDHDAALGGSVRGLRPARRAVEPGCAAGRLGAGDHPRDLRRRRSSGLVRARQAGAQPATPSRRPDRPADDSRRNRATPLDRGRHGCLQPELARRGGAPGRWGSARRRGRVRHAPSGT